LKELDIENFEVKKEPNKKISKTLLNFAILLKQLNNEFLPHKNLLKHKDLSYKDLYTGAGLNTVGIKI
jgi:hypothetical protein